MKTKKILSTILLLSIGTSATQAFANITDNGDGTQTVTGEAESSVNFVGKLGEFDPGTEPPGPGTPGPGDDSWIKVKLPTTVVYYSTGSSKHKTIDSPEHAIENQSNYPVKVEVSSFTDPSGQAPVTTGVKHLNLGNIPLVKDKVAEAFATPAQLFDLGAGGQAPVPGNFTADSTGSFKISGETDEALDVSIVTRLDNKVSFTFTALDENGKVVGPNTPNPPTPPTTPPASSEPTMDNYGVVDFMGKKWNAVKDMGNGNWLIALNESIGSSRLYNNSMLVYPTDDDSLDSYSNSDIKKVIDDWYKNNVVGTDYEKYVLPVTVNSPTLGDLKSGNYGTAWKSNDPGQTYTSTIAAVNAADAFPTVIDETNGQKQAFLMSGSDVAESRGTLSEYVNLSTWASLHQGRLVSKNIVTTILRTPKNYRETAGLILGKGDLSQGVSPQNNNPTTPALIINIPYCKR